MQRTHIHVIMIIAIGCLILFTNLGTTRLWDGKEPSNAGCALEMMERNNLAVPVFNNQLQTQQPVLLYWLIISAYQIFGVGEFAARFWSAALALGTIVATYGIGRRLFNPSAAIYAALILATNLMFVLAGRLATADSLVIFCNTMAAWLFVIGTFAPKTNPADAPILRWEGYYFPQRTGWIVAMYAMTGLAVLAKGPMGAVIPCSAIAIFMLVMRLPAVDNELWNSRGWLARVTGAMLRPFAPSHVRTTIWKMRPELAVVTMLIICGPWLYVVGQQTGWQWPQQFLLSESSAGVSVTGTATGGWMIVPAAILLGFFPWSLFLGPVVLEVDRQLTRRNHLQMAQTFLLCWIGTQVAWLMLLPTGSPTSVAPCFPALALLTGAFLSRLAVGKTATSAGLNRLTYIGMIVCGLLITATLIWMGKRYLSGDIRIATLGMIPVLGGVFALLLDLQQEYRWSVVTYCTSAVMLAIATFSFGTVAVERHQTNKTILDRLANTSANIPVGTFACMEPSWVYYGKRPVYQLSIDHQRGAWQDESDDQWQPRPQPTPEQFVEAYPNAMIITTKNKLDLLRQRLPRDYRVIERTSWFLKNQDLVLLSPDPFEHVAKSVEPLRR